MKNVVREREPFAEAVRMEVDSATKEKEREKPRRDASRGTGSAPRGSGERLSLLPEERMLVEWLADWPGVCLWALASSRLAPKLKREASVPAALIVASLQELAVRPERVVRGRSLDFVPSSSSSLQRQAAVTSLP